MLLASKCCVVTQNTVGYWQARVLLYHRIRYVTGKQGFCCNTEYSRLLASKGFVVTQNKVCYWQARVLL